MYLQNKYTIWYNNIIQQAQFRVLSTDTYTEKHHIIPRSLGGSNAKSNIVCITPREHFVCHLLLTKMTTGNNLFKMKHAVSMLMNAKNIGNGRYIPSSRLYEYVKKCHLEAINEGWTSEKRIRHSKKLVDYNSMIDKTSIAYISRIQKIKNYQESKVWSEKAIQSRLKNCLENAKKRKGSTWSTTHRQARLTSYLEKNIDTATKVFKLYDAGLNNQQISKELQITWDKVKYSLLHRVDFESHRLTH
jgi:hypothetical protein